MKAALLALVALAACKPVLTAESPSPPGRSARLEEVHDFWGLDHYRAELSQGVALAFSCYGGGPCEHMKVTSDDPSIAEVRLASLGTLQRSGMFNNATMAASVVVGKKPGTTRLHVRSDDDHGGRWIDVTVVAPPAPANRETVAR